MKVTQIAIYENHTPLITERPDNLFENVDALDFAFRKVRSKRWKVELFESDHVRLVWTFSGGAILSNYMGNDFYDFGDANNKFDNLVSNESQVIKGRTLLLVKFKNSRNNFAHFILEKFPLYFYFIFLSDYKEFDNFIVDAPQVELFNEILGLLGIKAKVFAADRDGDLKFEKLMFASNLAHPVNKMDPLALSGFEDFKKKLPARSKNLPTKIFITRKKGRRGVVNEAELYSLLRSNGIEIISFDNISFLKQVQYIRSAKLVISVHGAALANLVFCNKNEPPSCIEIFPNDYGTPAFWVIAKALDMKYIAIPSENDWHSTRNFDSHQKDITIDLERLEEEILRLDSMNSYIK